MSLETAFSEHRQSPSLATPDLRSIPTATSKLTPPPSVMPHSQSRPQKVPLAAANTAVTAQAKASYGKTSDEPIDVNKLIADAFHVALTKENLLQGDMKLTYADGKLHDKRMAIEQRGQHYLPRDQQDSLFEEPVPVYRHLCERSGTFAATFGNSPQVRAATCDILAQLRRIANNVGHAKKRADDIQTLLVGWANRSAKSVRTPFIDLVTSLLTLRGLARDQAQGVTPQFERVPNTVSTLFRHLLWVTPYLKPTDQLAAVAVARLRPARLKVSEPAKKDVELAPVRPVQRPKRAAVGKSPTSGSWEHLTRRSLADSLGY